MDMKWKNKGHEFDEIGNEIKNKNILFLGCDTEFRENTSFLNLEYRTIQELPEFKKIRGALFAARYLIAKQKISAFYKKLNLDNEIIIVSDENKLIYDMLLKFCNFKEDKDIYLESNFIKNYLPIYSVYKFNKVYNPHSTAIIVTTLCTLNCKYCLNFQPYIKDKCNVDYDDLIRDIDAFFTAFDYVEYFALSGGEPLIYKRLPELLEYIYKNYRHKIKNFWLPTNGTIIPDDNLCKLFKEIDIEILVDNYTKSVPEIKDTYYQTIQKCKDFNLKYRTNISNNQFFILFPPAKDYTKLSQDELAAKFNTCKNVYSGFCLKDSKLSSCCYSQFAETAKLIQQQEGEQFSLNNTNKKELLEFVMGYTEQGYTEFCKYCNCFIGAEEDIFAPDGVAQFPKDRYLEWDINNPTKEPVEVKK